MRAAKLLSLFDTHILAFGVLGDVIVVHIFAEFFPVSNSLEGVVPRHIGVKVTLNPQVAVICAEMRNTLAASSLVAPGGSSGSNVAAAIVVFVVSVGIDKS